MASRSVGSRVLSICEQQGDLNSVHLCLLPWFVFPLPPHEPIVLGNSNLSETLQESESEQGIAELGLTISYMKMLH